MYPHQICYLSIYEDEHSFDNDYIRATLYYRGASAAAINVNEDIKLPIYNQEVHIQGGDWVDSYQWGLRRMNELGVRESHCVPVTANKETENEKVVAILYWSRTVEDSLNTRDGGCCAVF